MLKQIKIALLAATVIFAASCNTSLITSSKYDKGTDFSVYKTYSLAKMDAPGITPENKDYILQSVKTELAKKGYTESNTNPDMLLNISSVVKQKQRKVSKTNISKGSSDLFTSIYWSQYKDPSVQTTVTDPNVKDGILLITVSDAKTRKTLWEATGYTELTKAPKNPEQAISKAVNKIMAKLPSTI